MIEEAREHGRIGEVSALESSTNARVGDGDTHNDRTDVQGRSREDRRPHALPASGAYVGVGMGEMQVEGRM